MLLQSIEYSAYPWPTVLSQLQILCTPNEYLKFLETPEAYLRKYGEHFSRTGGYIPYKNPAYWEVMPIYEYAECPICHTRISDPGDTYSIRVWGRTSDEILLDALYGVAEDVPIGPRCPHFLGMTHYANLHGHRPDEQDNFTNYAGELPFITPRLVPEDIESYAVLHALPICRIEGGRFVPRYTVFVLTYFARDPRRVLRRIYRALDSLTYDGYRHLDPVGTSTDLTPWVQAGKLGWLDFSEPGLPLRIGQGLTIHPVYQNIPGQSEAYSYYPGKADTKVLSGRRLRQYLMEQRRGRK